MGEGVTLLCTYSTQSYNKNSLLTKPESVHTSVMASMELDAEVKEYACAVCAVCVLVVRGSYCSLCHALFHRCKYLRAQDVWRGVEQNW